MLLRLNLLICLFFPLFAFSAESTQLIKEQDKALAKDLQRGTKVWEDLDTPKVLEKAGIHCFYAAMEAGRKGIAKEIASQKQFKELLWSLSGA